MTKKASEHISYTLSTNAIESMAPGKDAVRCCEQISDGKLSADQAVEILLRKRGLSKVK
ncbi:MAG: hypothetical protein IJS65_02860 [Clostridia bacterium]|nr:hypothetical protein [Clostridia bacterium]